MHDELMKMVEAVFDRPTLKRVCEMHESEFGAAYGLAKVAVAQAEPADYYYFKDNGADTLAVAHLDTVVNHAQRLCNFVETAGGPVVHSGALDDRLGAYIILELLPRLGITHDILLTVGEESGISTAQFFEPAKEYNWLIEFDRGGTDVVLYEYEDEETRQLVRDCGARVGLGAFSDISYMEHVGVKGFNWGVGYQDYHSVRGYAYLEDTISMVAHYLVFHAVNVDVTLPHEERPATWWRGYRGSDRSRCENCFEEQVDLETDWCEACGVCNSCWSDALGGDECQCSWAVDEREQRAREEESDEIESVLGRQVEDVLVRDGVL